MSQPESVRRLSAAAKELAQLADDAEQALHELPVNAGALERIAARLEKAAEKGRGDYQKEVEKAQLFLYSNAFDRMFLTRDIVEAYFRRNRWKFPAGKGWSQAIKKKVCEVLQRHRSIAEFRADARQLIAEFYIDFVNLNDDELRQEMRACETIAQLKSRIPKGLAPKPAPKKMEAYIEQVLLGLRHARSQFAHEFEA